MSAENLTIISFRGTTFCASDCTKVNCSRHFDHKDQKAYEAWWPNAKAPIAFSDLSPTCLGYSPGGTDLPELVKERIALHNPKEALPHDHTTTPDTQ